MSGHRVVQSSKTHFYCATKYAVTALTEGLRQELREIKSGIRVTVSRLFLQPVWIFLNFIYFSLPSTLKSISPGLVRTEFAPRLEKATDVEQAKKDYDKKVQGVSGQVFRDHTLSFYIIILSMSTAIGGRRHCRCHSVCHLLSS